MNNKKNDNDFGQEQQQNLISARRGCPCGPNTTAIGQQLPHDVITQQPQTLHDSAYTGQLDSVKLKLG